MITKFRSRCRVLLEVLKNCGLSSSEAVRALIQLTYLKLSEARGLFFGRSIRYFLTSCKKSKDVKQFNLTLNACFTSLPEQINTALPVTLPLSSIDDVAEFCESIDFTKLELSALADVYEQTLSDTSSSGAYYTDEQSIQEQLDSLFLASLKAEADSLETKLEAIDFLEKLKEIKLLDAAAGCGNFLLSAFRELKNIERDVCVRFDLNPQSPLDFENIYGIELTASSVQMAQLLAILQRRVSEMELCLNAESGQLPSLDYEAPESFITANALEYEWPAGLSYIIGNPPYANYSLTEEQKADCHKYGIGNLDYSFCWLEKADQYMQEHSNCRAAFVLPNSSCQGAASSWWEQHDGLNIIWAYQSYKWRGSSADLHCINIGLSRQDIQPRTLHTSAGRTIECDYINCYLQPGRAYAATRQGTVRKIFTSQRKYLSIPAAARKPDVDYVRYLTADGIYADREEYALLDDIDKKELTFHDGAVIVIPRHCSEQRRYIPIAYFTDLHSFVVDESAFYVIDNDYSPLALFGLLQSAAHQDFVQTYCGRLGMRYRYSVKLFSSFPFPKLTSEQTSELEALAGAVLDARSNSEGTLGSIYKEMPSKLRSAHLKLDAAVDRIMFGKIIFRATERAKLVTELTHEEQ